MSVPRFTSALVVLTLLASGCSAGFTTAHLENVRLSTTEEGKPEVKAFAPTDGFFVVGDIANAPPDTKLKAVWTAVDAEGSDANTALSEKELESGDGEFQFSLTNESNWPDGKYKVDLFIDDKLVETVEFDVGQVSANAQSEAGSDDAVAALEDVKSAVVQIVAQGSFMDPEVGEQLNAAGAGSGFFIDPSGIAVTNNHVVTGAAILKVMVAGEDKPRNAKILGVSECSDLAVIDVEGDGFRYLAWHDGRISAGLDVYAAGFPLGDPEYTLTRGIVSKERANGDTGWASVAHVLQHDANLNPGNSGGPLVSANGRVVGINYASGDVSGQNFAIARDEATAVIERLRSGEDVNSVGINGTAVNDGEGLSGIWVASVASGSPADETGVKGGDLVTKLEGLVLATDGTMVDYCDILEGHEPADKLRVEVLRFSQEQMMEGQLNGRTLEPSFSFAQALEDEVDPSAATAPGAEAYDEYTTVQDDSGAIAMQVPKQWDDIDGTPWLKNDVDLGVSVTVSSDRETFLNSYTTPGAFFGASPSLAKEYDPKGMLDWLKPDLGVSSCTFEGREDYSDPYYTGVYDSYSDCGGEKAGIVTVAAVPEDNSVMLFLLVQVVSESDLEALDKIIDTFQIIGELP